MPPALAVSARTSLVTALVAALVAASAVLPQRAEGVLVSQTYRMPVEGTVTLVGHGYGHGHGMSQYGAEGAARQGLTWQQIVGFYYPGTAEGKNTSLVRVLITADTTRDVLVAARSGLKVQNMRTRQLFTLPANGAKRWRLNVSGSNTVVAYRTDRWRRWKTFTGDGAFYAGGAPIRVFLAGTSRTYRGTVIAASPYPGSTDRDTVNVLQMDHYLKGVVPREMPASWSPMAVRAQAVAARTYASYEQRRPRARHYQLCDTTSCQVYGGYGVEDARTNDAIAKTAGVILTSAGSPAFTQFGSSSGGWTAANQFDYLPAQEDPYDDWAGNPVHNWTKTIDLATIERIWPAVGNLRGIKFLTRDGNGDWSGRVWTLELIGTKDDVNTRVQVSGSAFRSKLGLRSTWFTVESVLARQ